LTAEPAIQFLSPLEISYCCVVMVVSYALRGSTGFGAAAAMPLLGLVIPLKVLIPAWTLIGLPPASRFLAVTARTLPGARWRACCRRA